MIKKIKVFANNNEKSLDTSLLIKNKIEKCGYILDNNNFDLAIAVGGDGTFLRMIKECNFDDEVLYLGVNTGTLGFAQEIYPTDIDNFLDRLSKGEYKIENIGVQETNVYTSDSVSHFYSLNEIVLRESELNTLHLNIMIDDNLLETFVGDGILLSTSFGSTAYNLSFGGSIVYNELHTLQITPIAPLNSRSYRTLLNSVIVPEDRKITSIPILRSKDLIITIDGVNNRYKDVSKVETFIKKKKIKCLRMYDYDYTKKINEKFTKD